MSTPQAPTTATSQLKRWFPLAILAMLIAAAYGFGLHKYLSLESIARNRDGLESFVRDNLVLAILIYAGVYIAAVALSLPGAAILSILGGFVFGWAISAPVTVVAATLGATIVYYVVKTSLGATLAERAGPFVQKLSDGFARDAFNYLLFLRLVPAFPFVAVNAVAGLARVNVKTFIAATFLGIIPGSIAFAWVGRGLDSVLDAQDAAHGACVAAKGEAACPFELSLSSLVTTDLLIAFAALGVVALIPVGLKKWKAT